MKLWTLRASCLLKLTIFDKILVHKNVKIQSCRGKNYLDLIVTHLTTQWTVKKTAWGSFQYPIRCLIIRSHKVLNPLFISLWNLAVSYAVLLASHLQNFRIIGKLNTNRMLLKLYGYVTTRCLAQYWTSAWVLSITVCQSRKWPYVKMPLLGHQAHWSKGNIWTSGIAVTKSPYYYHNILLLYGYSHSLHLQT